MDVFVGRQPILDRNLRTYAYELLFRSGAVNRYDGADPVAATASVIANTFLSIGSDQILGKCKGFMNFPRESLSEEATVLLPQKTVVIEVLEDVTPDPEVIANCQKLSERGYMIALDDFVDRPECSPLTKIADFIKVDFRATLPEERKQLAVKYGGRGIRMLAEKVESQEEFEEARANGYCYFQGYFFAKPLVISATEVPATKLNLLRVLRELQRPELNFPNMEALLRLDVSLSQKLLRYMNSAAFGWSQRIESITRALVALGEDNFRKWLSLAAMTSLVSDKPPELVWESLTRARLCELLAERCGLRNRSADCFLMGLFSMLDAMIGRPLPELLPGLGLPLDVVAALDGSGKTDDVISRLFALCLACQKADVEQIEQSRLTFRLSFDAVSQISLDAIAWSELVCRESGVSH